MINDVVSGII